MTAPDAPVEPARPRQQAATIEPEPKSNEVKAESPTAIGTDFATRIGLTAGDPSQTLRFLGDLTRNANLSGVPDIFGRIDIAFNDTSLSGLSGLFHARNRQSAQRDQYTPGDNTLVTDRGALLMDGNALRRVESLPPGVSRIERTRITGTGANVDTQVEIRYGMDGKPNFLRDHLGEWKSEDGGKTWKTGEPNLRVRRGEVSIDANGNYTYANDDYGVKSTFSSNGNVTRTITNSAGEQFSVTRDKQGVPTGFTDKSGEWTGDGRNWTNTTTGEKKSGAVQLTEFGEFRFKPNRGDNVVEQTPQLERIKKLQDEICKEFNISFAQPGEKQKNEGRDPHAPPEAQLYAGVPSEAELNTLRNVLTNTNHEDYRGMKVWFIRPDENDRPHFGEYRSNPTDKPHAGECGGCCNGRGITDARNGNMIVLPRARQETNGFGGLEGTLYHELGHHEQRLKGYLSSGDMFGRGSTPESRQLAQDMGWKWSERLKQPVLEDKNGGLWRFDHERAEFRWAGGTQPGPGEKRKLNFEEMRDRAKVPSINNYFDNPVEMHAESLAGFRLGVTGKERAGGDRRTLAIDSPQMYETIKKYDQARIDSRYGTNPGGESKMIRGLDGKIIENTPENRRAIQAAEYQWRLEHLSLPRTPVVRDPQRRR